MTDHDQTEGWPERAAGTATSSSLLRRLQTREPEAWRQWADLYGPLVYYWCRRHSLQPDDAADVFQEVSVSVAGGIRGFRHDRARGRFRGWLWTITRNKIQDHFRHASREEALDGQNLALIEAIPRDLDDNNPPGVERNQLVGLVQRAAAIAQGEFEPASWRAFWRTVVDRQPTHLVAEELGISAGAVRIAKSRVLRRIRIVLGELGE